MCQSAPFGGIFYGNLFSFFPFGCFNILMVGSPEENFAPSSPVIACGQLPGHLAARRSTSSGQLTLGLSTRYLASPARHRAEDKWVRNPIDRFILSHLESAAVAPAPPADPSALLRRAYYDLTGLPPSPEQVETYLTRVEGDDSADAVYEQMIDHLLTSPQYGERWGRHWLDLVRYAETDSYERDNPKPNAWKYRDYVIRSFNSDKPYDQFVREQLAGDEIPGRSYETVIATGYYRLGLWDDEPVDPLQAYYDHLDDVVSTTSEVFLGLTINCARCHDHKIDPISQQDYYRFMAFFHNILNNVKKGPYEDFAFTLNTQIPLATPQQQAEWKDRKQQHEKLLAELTTKIDQLEQKVVASLSKGEQDDAKDNANVRKRLIHKNWENALSKEDQALWKVLQEQREADEKTGPAPLPARPGSPRKRQPGTRYFCHGAGQCPGIG